MPPPDESAAPPLPSALVDRPIMPPPDESAAPPLPSAIVDRPITPPPNESAAAPSPSAVDELPEDDQAVQVAAALEQMIQSNYAANQDVHTPRRDQETAQQSPYQQAFETFIDQTKFTPASARRNKEDTCNVRLTQEALEKIALGGDNIVRGNTPPPANDDPFLDHRPKQEDLLDHDMDQAQQHEDLSSRPLPSPHRSPSPMTDVSEPHLTTVENPPESDSSELSEQESNDEHRVDEGSDDEGGGAGEDGDDEDGGDEDVDMSEGETALLPPAPLPPRPPSPAPLPTQHAKKSPMRLRNKIAKQSKTTTRSPPQETIELSSDDSDGEPEVVLPDSRPKHAKPQKAAASTASTRAHPQPIPGTKYIMKSTLQGTLHSNIRGNTMLDMKVMPVRTVLLQRSLKLTSSSPDDESALHLPVFQP
jgi:hypothetical protein